MTHTDNASCTSETVCMIQLGRRNKLMRSIEDNSFTLVAPPADKLHYRCDPKLDGARLKKQYDRSNLAQSIRTPFALKKVEKSLINDRSFPLIEEDVHVKFSERRAFLHMLLLQVERFYIRVLETVVHIHHSSVDTAKYFAEHAPVKAREILEQGKGLAHSAVDVSVGVAHSISDTASETQHAASELYTDAVRTGKDQAAAAKVNAQGLLESGKGKVSAVKLVAQGILESGKETANEVVHDVRKSAAIASAFASVVAEKAGEVIERGRQILRSSSQEEIASYRRAKPRSRTEEASIYAAYAALLRDVEQNRQDSLNHVLLSEMSDRSKPFIPSSFALGQNQKNQGHAYPFHARRQLLSEIKRPATLKSLNHVLIRDASAPAIPTEVKGLLKNDRKKLLSELKETDAKEILTHVSETSDRSAPSLPDCKIDLHKGNSKKALLEEVKAGVDLAKASEIHDRSAPLIQAGISAM